MCDQCDIRHDACKLQIGQTLSKLLRRTLFNKGRLIGLHCINQVVRHQAIEAWFKSRARCGDGVHQFRQVCTRSVVAQNPGGRRKQHLANQMIELVLHIARHLVIERIDSVIDRIDLKAIAHRHISADDIGRRLACRIGQTADEGDAATIDDIVSQQSSDDFTLQAVIGNFVSIGFHHTLREVTKQQLFEIRLVWKPACHQIIRQ